jgi:mRNA interferase RelE/StbE
VAAKKAKSSDKSKIIYQVEFAPTAVKQLRGLDKPFQAQIIRRIEKLADDPRPPGVEKLAGEDGFYRIRSGNYRILYTINDKAFVVLVLRIGDRKEVYRQLPNLL